MEQIQKIREKCIEANPDILKLEFGCVVRYEWENEEVEELTIGTQVLDNFILVGDGSEVEVEREEIIEILGRKIGLCDVLLAIDNKNLNVQAWNGVFSLKDTSQHVSWNLRTDDLTLQSPATIEFIYNLLY